MPIAAWPENFDSTANISTCSIGIVSVYVSLMNIFYVSFDWLNLWFNQSATLCLSLYSTC